MKRCADDNYFDSLLLQYSLIADDTDHAGHQIHNVFFLVYNSQTENHCNHFNLYWVLLIFFHHFLIILINISFQFCVSYVCRSTNMQQ